MMLLGPPTRQPMMPSMNNMAGAGSDSANTAKNDSMTTRAPIKVAITQARRPP
jgi:hypothetical protein